MKDWERLRDTSGVSILLAIATDQGMRIDDCLRGTQIVQDQLETPLVNIAVWQELELLRNMQNIRETDVGLGLMAAKRSTASAMGMFGQALATSKTLKQARQLIQNYQLMGMSFSPFEFLSNGAKLSLTLHDSEMPIDCQRFCEERGLGGCLVMFSDLLGHQVTPRSVSMRLPPARDESVYHEFFGVHVKFNAPETTISFDREIEGRELPNANRKLHLASIRYCDEVIESHAQIRSYAERARNALMEIGLSGGIGDIAHRFGMSERQLRRYLSKESTTFREIQQNLRVKLARNCLHSGMSVEQVAFQLGYTSQASFSRAFKKQTGTPPSMLRRTI